MFIQNSDLALSLNLQYYFMMFREDQLRISQYLQAPHKHPRPYKDEDRHFVYLLTYLGQLFVQGYRIVQQFADIILFSLMEFQISEQLDSASRHQYNLPARFKLILWQIDDSRIFENGKQRRQIYNRLLLVGKCLEEVQYNIIYLHSFRYSILNRAELQRGTFPNAKFYYSKIQWIEQRNGLKPVHEKDEGIALHKLVQIFVKGAGQARNIGEIQKIQKHNKFVYDLFKVINTVCYILGKEFLENQYQTMSVEKWMRWTTCKKFKRFDLLLRNEQKCCIIDWKFSRLQAQEKIRGNSIAKKNKVYYQLASKDFKTNVELKFICFHERIMNQYYHMVTCAPYLHKIDEVQIDDPTVIYELDDDSDSSMEIFKKNLIVPSEEDLQMIADIPDPIARPLQISANIIIAQNNAEEIQQISKTDYERHHANRRCKNKQIIKERRKGNSKVIDNAIQIESD